MTDIVTTLEQDLSTFGSNFGAKVAAVSAKIVAGGAAILTTLEGDEKAIANGAAEFATFVDNGVNAVEPYISEIPALSGPVAVFKEIFDNLAGILEAIGGGAQAPGGETPPV